MTLPNSFSGISGTNKTNRGGLAPSSQTLGSLLRTPWPAKPAGKLDFMSSQSDKVGYHLDVEYVEYQNSKSSFQFFVKLG